MENDRLFAEQGLDIIPQIHLGEKAAALEKAGIQSERGNINRRIIEQNQAILTAKMLVAKAEEHGRSKESEYREFQEKDRQYNLSGKGAFSAEYQADFYGQRKHADYE